MNKSTERNAFSSRLQLALRNANHPSSHPTHLAREFNFRFSGSPITVHAARKWLVGESIPTQDKLRALSTWLGVTAEWLRFGGPGDEVAVKPITTPGSGLESAQNRLLSDFMKLDDHHRQIVQEFIGVLVEKRRRPASEGTLRAVREVKAAGQG